LGRVLALSPRELEIARGVMADEKEMAIAVRLGISVHTVHTHLERIYRKMGVSSRVQLVVAMMGKAYPCASTGVPAGCPLERLGRCGSLGSGESALEGTAQKLTGDRGTT
jgi:DNA-binding CsgD family transcriptional regulator